MIRRYVDQLQIWSQETPDASVILAPGQPPLSYRGLWEQVEETARTLRTGGIRPNPAPRYRRQLNHRQALSPDDPDGGGFKQPPRQMPFGQQQPITPCVLDQPAARLDQSSTSISASVCVPRHAVCKTTVGERSSWRSLSPSTLKLRRPWMLYGLD